MSHLQAQVTTSHRAFHVEGYEKIEYDLVYVDGVFALDNFELADSNRPYGRALMVVDDTVYDLYGDAVRNYFDYHDIALTVVPVPAWPRLPTPHDTTSTWPTSHRTAGGGFPPT